MARCRAMLLMSLVLASTLCSANAGLVAAEPGRKLLFGVVDDLSQVLNSVLGVVITVDARQLGASVDPGKLTLVVEAGDPVAVVVEAGKVAKLAAAKVKVKDGAVRVRLQILGVDVVIVLNLAKLKAILGNGEVTATLVLKVDEVKKMLHLQNADGECCADVGINLEVDG